MPSFRSQPWHPGCILILASYIAIQDEKGDGLAGLAQMVPATLMLKLACLLAFPAQ